MDDSAGNGRAALPRRPGGAAMEEAGRSASQSGPQAGQSGPQAGHPSVGGSGPLSASRSASQSAGLSSLGASGVQARWLGKRVGRFRLVSMLGKGAYGRVFLAEDVDLQRRVALKIITAEATSKSIREEAAAAGDAMDSARLDEAVAQAVDRMIREARAAARMEHPNVVHVYEIGRLDGTGLGGYIAMELLDGGTLQDLIRATGPMDAARACTLVAEAADALQHGHDMGVVHRDVKPANLMLSRAGRCKVADFGLACVDDPNDCHRAMPIAGTALFLAPEIMSGALPDPKTDQYSLAVTLFTLLAGRPPYVGTRRQVLEAHVRSPVPDLLMVRPDLDPKLFEVIRRGMSKDPGKRFPSIRQFGQALRLFTVAVAAPPPAPEPMPAGVFDDVLAEAAQGPSIATPVHYAPRRSMDLSKVLPLAIGGGIVAMLLIIVLILWAAGAFSRPEPQAQLSQRPPAPQQRPAEPARNDPPANNPPVEQPRQQQQQQPEQKTEPVQPPPAQPQQQPPPQQQQQQEQAPPAGIQPPAQQPGQAAAGGAPEIKLGPGELAATDYRGLVRVAMGYDTERANKRATVVGQVAVAQISESGKVVRITFRGAEGDRVFDVVYFPSGNMYQKMADRFGGANGAGIKGKTIRVTGSVGMFQNDPQIVVESPDQIEIIE